jgi:superfamily II DNA or RNA helicase
MKNRDGAGPQGPTPGKSTPHHDAITLHDHQAKTLGRLERHGGDATVEQPTGAGKTVIAKAFAGSGLGVRFSHLVIAAPQEQIERSFVNTGHMTIQWPVGFGAQPAIELPTGFIETARSSGAGSRRHLKRYCELTAPSHVVACTHAALTKLTESDLPDDMAGFVLIVDEGHHGPADELGRVINLWRSRGGRLIYFTATPFRFDGRPVVLPDMLHVRRSLAEHMEEGGAPRHLESEIVALGTARDRVDASQFAGETTPPEVYRKAIVRGIVKRWLADGKPKLIVRVPPSRPGSRDLIAELTAALARNGARVLDASGVSDAKKKNFIDTLEAERRRSYAESRVDVIVGVMRVLEGSDWKHAAAAYSVGIPRSLVTVIQFVGRALRAKPDDYPVEYRDRARIVFFVPAAGGRALDELAVDHSRHTLLVSTFLVDHSVGHEWAATRAVREGIASGLAAAAGTAAADDAEIEADRALEPEVRAQVELAIASAREELVAAGGEPVVEAIVARAKKERPDLPKEAFARVAVEILTTEEGSVGEHARARLRRAVARRLRIDPQVREALREAFDEVLDEFRGATLANSPVLETVGRQIHQITGRSAIHFARRLAESVPRPLTPEMIVAWADETFQETGDWPNENSGSVIDEPTENWAAIDRALRNGHRTLAGRLSLAQLLFEKRGVPNRLAKPDFDEDEIVAWADAYKKATGDWPTRDSGTVEGTANTWSAIDQALHKGGRGLEGGTSLALLLETERGARNIRSLPPLKSKNVVKWAERYFKKHKQWPTPASGQIDGAPDGETWMRVIGAVQQGLRGLEKRTSLNALLREHGRNAESNRALRLKLTKEKILELLRDYHERTGEWPGELTKDPELEKTGLNWRKVDRALREGARGLPGSSSIAKLLAAELGVRNGNRPGKLRESQIRAWALAYKKKTGEWPSRDSGDVDGAPGEKWANIHQALRTGKRGLQSGMTLKQFIEMLLKRRRPSA